MNPNTGHLIDVSGMGIEELKKLHEAGYYSLPPDLSRAAKKKLAGNSEAYVSLKSGGKLSSWAKDKRKKKHKKKIAKVSKKRNRQ